jgi:hypothetical protein
VQTLVGADKVRQQNVCLSGKLALGQFFAYLSSAQGWRAASLLSLAPHQSLDVLGHGCRQELLLYKF